MVTLKTIFGNKYLTLVPINKSKQKTEKYEELWSKIIKLIRAITKKSGDYNEKYLKFKFNSVDELPLNKTTEITTMIIVVRTVFHENNKSFPQFFLEEWLHKI